MKDVFHHPWVQLIEKEMFDEMKNIRTTDSISTNHNSSASSNTIKEYRKHIKKVDYCLSQEKEPLSIIKYNEGQVVNDKELNNFCLLDNNDSIFDRVLVKVNERGKFKSKEKILKYGDNTAPKKESLDPFKVTRYGFNDSSNGEPYNNNNENNKNYTLFDEIKYDIQNFNQIVNPKTINLEQENIDRINSKENNNNKNSNKFTNIKTIKDNDDNLYGEKVENSVIKEFSHLKAGINDENLKKNRRATDCVKLKNIDFTPTPE